MSYKVTHGMSNITNADIFRLNAENDRLRARNAKMLAALKLALTQDHLDRNILDAINAAIAAAAPRRAG